ncbi:hypothetical protein [Brevundimonas sp.]|uniref:hypothetical protein n=1 Tax=Brevundimonas sp. TaxID=1871086 RepID=UPI00272FAAF7|nr:hypothetical protein [Brevundimonas sp.]MDP1912732.1 hypothetical protein [Brevundimonas sp.]
MIALHWLMLLLLAVVHACIELREHYPRGGDIREGLKTWHFMLGLSGLSSCGSGWRRAGGRRFLRRRQAGPAGQRRRGIWRSMP